MRGPLALFIALRYLRARRRDRFVSFVVLASTLGMVLGVMALVTVLSVMNGFEREMRERVLGMVPHVLLGSHSGLEDWRSVAAAALEIPGVEAAAPFVEGQAMLSAGGRTHPVLFQGIDPEWEGQVSIIGQHLLGSELTDLVAGDFKILLGQVVAGRLGVQPGDPVILVVPRIGANAAGVFPRLKRFEVVGIFELGAQVDDSLALLHIEDANRLLQAPGTAMAVRLRLDDVLAAPARAASIHAQVEQRTSLALFVTDWTRTQGALFRAIGMEKLVVGLLLFLIIAVAAFNILSTLVMTVASKTSDIAILQTLGADRGLIRRIFIIQGTLVGLFGALLGGALGVALSLGISDIFRILEDSFGLNLLSVYFITYFPSDLRWGDVALVCGTALLTGMLATIYPARRAARVEPADALRYD